MQCDLDPSQKLERRRLRAFSLVVSSLAAAAHRCLWMDELRLRAKKDQRDPQPS